jgi:hypothetical protein
VSALLQQRPRLAKGGASDSETSDGDTSDSDQSDAGKESQSSSTKKEAKEVVTAESAPPSTAPGTKDWSSMVVAEIKEECKRLNLKVTGKKADLIERIEQHMAAGGTAAALAPPSGPPAPQVPETVERSVAAPAARTDAAPGRIQDFEKYTISDLKEMLRSNKLKVSGKKADLIMRCVDNNIAAS